MKHQLLFSAAVLSAMALASCSKAPVITETNMGDYIVVTQTGGATLGYSPESGITLLDQDG